MIMVYFFLYYQILLFIIYIYGITFTHSFVIFLLYYKSMYFNVYDNYFIPLMVIFLL
jgi:hypothetical protein